MPDVETLRLCALLTNLAFAIVFAARFYMSRDENYLWWCAATLFYITSVAGFELVRPYGPLVGMTLYAILGMSVTCLLAGTRAFDGRRPLTRGMLALPLATMAAAGVPGLVALAGLPLPQACACSVAPFALTIGTGLIASRLRLGEGTGRNMAGAALLAFVPCYAVRILERFTDHPAVAALATLSVLFDQMLLMLVYSGLLTMPAERLRHELRQRAYRDELTGARNRMWLTQHCERLAADGAAAILIDLDHFKTINDRYGHGTGDRVLARIAAVTMPLVAAHGGELVRLGGDEFLALLPGVAAGAAPAVAEGIRRRIAAADTTLPVCTVSVGFATVQPGETSLVAVVQRADRGLYVAKAHGRDRIAA